MKPRAFVVLFLLMAFLLAVSLACNFGAGTPAVPTSIVPNRPTQPNQPIQKPTDAPPAQQPSNSPDAPPTQQPSNPPGGLQTFTDKNNLYQIQLPGDWIYSQTTGDNFYIDTFKSPDKKAVVENIAYDDGTPFTGSQNGRFALDLLNRFYSNTGEVGDIRVLGDQIMTDGSERLEWVSKSGGYSGYSYFEIRNKTTFLMITIDWANSAKDQYIATLDAIIESYRLP